MPNINNDVFNPTRSKITTNDTYDSQTGENGLRFGGKEVWVTVHTRAGYEYKVQDNIRKLAVGRQMTDKVLKVEIPTKDVLEEDSKGRKVVKTKKLFPGYVYVKMIVNNDTWYLVRNADGVTGFVGVGVEPTPLLEEEVRKLNLDKGEKAEKAKVESGSLKKNVGDIVDIKDGPFEGYSGRIDVIDIDKQTLRVIVEMFNRETPVELNFDQVGDLY